MTPNSQTSPAELSNGSSDPMPAEDLMADNLAGAGLRASAETGVGSFDAVPAAAQDGEPPQDSHGE